ncbi:MAG: FHA domain-containing protein [Gammaproteobacteria bacterium]|nr:FHA domain-containing protein [Gammaproteobacteria bacterium]
MQVRLKPVSHPELGDIIIADALFPVGRDEVPFAAYGADAVCCLSRRHARLFSENGGFYVADLGSRNGTTVNGKIVAVKPARLRQGDEICFGQHLTYRVDFPDAANDAASRGPETHLTLVPSSSGDIAAIAVNRFPFLVSKADDTFSQYAPRHDDEVNYLSRRHAHLFLKEGIPYIEDLGSTNGTWVNGVRLDEHARALTDGDIVAFGGDFFSYSVRMEPQTGGVDATESPVKAGDPGALPARASPEGKTTFVETANSFLDIFCVEEEENRVGDPKEVEEAVKEKDVSRPAEARPGYLRRKWLFIKELKGSFSEPGTGRSRGLWVFMVLLLLVGGAVATTVYLVGRQEREIERLLAAGDYEGSASAANAYLALHPDSPEIRDLATESLMKYAVPRWAEAIRGGDHTGARRVLNGARAISAANTDGLELLDLLGWMTEVDAFVEMRGGHDAPIEIYVDEASINALIDWWETDDERNRRRMRLILEYEPSSGDLQARAYSALRELRSERSVYLAALDRLRPRIEAALAADRTAGLAEEIERVGDKYPRIAGLDQVLADLDAYLDIQEKIGARDLMGVMEALDASDFRTPPFLMKAAAIRRDVLPPPEISAEYRAASDAWLSGDIEENLSILAGLTDNSWGEVAQAELDRNRRIADEFAKLGDKRDTPGYGDALLSFHAMLDPQRDAYFLSAIEADMQVRSAEALARAQEAEAEAREKWEAYRSGGGIPGILRLEDGISATYRRQAGALSAARVSAWQAYRIRELLGLDDPQAQRRLRTDIDREVRLQRLSLNELGMVLNPTLLREKLALLPAPDSRAGGAN